jgi:hypothetical protein
MIKIDDDKKDNKTGKILICVISIVLSLVFTYIIMNFVDFNDMLDSFKISFKTLTLQKIVKYFSFTIGIIYIALYSVLYFAFYKVADYIYETRLKK